MKFASLFLLALPLAAAAAAPAKQDIGAMHQAAETFLRQQTAGQTGKVAITIGKIDARTAPDACPQMEAFLQAGARAWGATAVGLRCAAPNWTRYVQAKVTVTGDYVAAAAPLAQGQVVNRGQLTVLQGELTALPHGVLTDPAQADGRILTLPVQAGAPLRADILRSQPVILQGQTVQLVSSGQGFRVSTEARALGNASEGHVVQVRTQAGRTLSGIARQGGLVEVQN
jgi:flagella basal body P-ring formation protein FlgA